MTSKIIMVPSSEDCVTVPIPGAPRVRVTLANGRQVEGRAQSMTLDSAYRPGHHAWLNLDTGTCCLVQAEVTYLGA